MTCENCKYWDRENKATVEMSWGKKIAGMASCLNKDFINDNKPLILSNEDAPDSGFIVSPDFGCDQFINND